MIAAPEKPDIAAVLQPLKDFQVRTVDYAFQQLYKNGDGSGRFLVADEVGLGKTLVARGVVAKTIEHLWDSTPRIDIIYICSNADIARQNIARLTIPGLNHFKPADRITLLPISSQQENSRNFKDEKVNFVPLTPGTSFRMYSQFGTVNERALLYHMLKDSVEMPMDGAMHVFAGDADKKKFRYKHTAKFDTEYHIDPGLEATFLNEFAKNDNQQLRDDLVNLCQLFHMSRKAIRKENRAVHKKLIHALRELLANICMDALEPDLVIMDEFQRFKHLLHGNNAAGELAQKLFNFPEVRTLLLSATPYKMYTLHDEAAGENHHGDFLETLDFLYGDKRMSSTFPQLLQDYRLALLQYGNQEGTGRENSALLAAKTAVESRLQQVMARTEKLTASVDRNGMFRDMVNGHNGLQPQDLLAYVGLQQVSKELKHHNTLEYWKSAPYLLNFMESYKFKKNFQHALTIESKSQKLAQSLANTPQLLISEAAIEQYREVDPGNSRLRQLMADTIDSGAWQLLWIPPSLPYYQLERPFNSDKTKEFTKRLVFSAWHVVPKVVASLLSYEAERKVMRLFDDLAINTADERIKRRGLLRIARSEGRLTGMPVLGIMYPSPILAELGEPLTRFTKQTEGQLHDSVTILQEIQIEIERRLAQIPITQTTEGLVDERWYWAAPLLLDWQADKTRTQEWWQTDNLASLWAGEENEKGDDTSAWADHITLAQKRVLEDNPFRDLGRQPDDLSFVLAQMALGGPGNVALRALSRIADDGTQLSNPHLRINAATIAWAFRSLFNAPEAMALIRGLYQNKTTPYWQQLLAYSIDGCIQSVLDEYSHILSESVGLVEESKGGPITAVAQSMRSAIQLRTTSLKVDDYKVDTNNRIMPPGEFRLRSHYAQRFGDFHNDTNEKLTRKEAVREAFNSPFWPFVLVTTSVGQEGLDFHQYCHAIVHWNLPANPVDLEQREGRVHRYKGHAIRKNVASDFRSSSLLEEGQDPWHNLFSVANKNTDSDLVPFWIYPENGDGKASIERYVPILPLSRDAHRLVSLRKALTVYRMVFGQNRQEDLVNYLLVQVPEEQIDYLSRMLQINLEPPILDQKIKP